MKVADSVLSAPALLVLIPQRYRREFGRWRNRALCLRDSAGRRDPHGRWHLHYINV